MKILCSTRFTHDPWYLLTSKNEKMIFFIECLLGDKITSQNVFHNYVIRISLGSFSILHCNAYFIKYIVSRLDELALNFNRLWYVLNKVNHSVIKENINHHPTLYITNILWHEMWIDHTINSMLFENDLSISTEVYFTSNLRRRMSLCSEFVWTKRKMTSQDITARVLLLWTPVLVISYFVLARVLPWYQSLLIMSCFKRIPLYFYFAGLQNRPSSLRFDIRWWYASVSYRLSETAEWLWT